MKKASLLLIIFLFSFTMLYSEEKERIAIMNFSVKGVNPEIISVEAVVENLTTSLIKSNKFTVIERSQIDKVMTELQLQSSDEFDDKSRVEVGNILGVKKVILGSITQFGETITINVRGVDVITGEAHFAEKTNITNVNQIDEKITELVSMIINPNQIANSQKIETNETNEKPKKTLKTLLPRLKEKIAKRKQEKQTKE